MGWLDLWRNRGQQPEPSRDMAARRMQAFYEPGFFGQPTAYGEALNLANTSPTTMGGFQYMGFDPSLPTAPGVPAGTPEALAQQYQTRQQFDRPPVGMDNMGRYGVGQLKNYGKGALAAYQPLAREQQLRWR